MVMRVKVLVGLSVLAAAVSLVLAKGVPIELSRYMGLQTAETSSPKSEGGVENSAREHSGEKHHDQHSHAKEIHGGHDSHGSGHHGPHKILVTTPAKQDITLTESYVCQIHSRRHIDVRALEGGYLQEIHVNEGQSVKKGEVLFRILPTLYEARLEADIAESQAAQVEYENTLRLVQQNIESEQTLKMAKANLAKAQAKVRLAQAERDFAEIKAPFDGIVDRLLEQEGSLLEEGAKLTTLSDNSVMWVYFNVHEARYLEYQSSTRQNGDNQQNINIQLRLANHRLFEHEGKIGAIEADFNSQTGNIAFRADFPNPDGLLRHGQTGTVLIHRLEKDVVVIPQRATFEILAKKYAFVVDDTGTVHQREITIQNEQDDIFMISKGLDTGDKIILEGISQVRDGDRTEFEFLSPERALSNLKFHAE